LPLGLRALLEGLLSLNEPFCVKHGARLCSASPSSSARAPSQRRLRCDGGRRGVRLRRRADARRKFPSRTFAVAMTPTLPHGGSFGVRVVACS
jgi:hypothetical protein